jgi:phosphate uptake regulator
MENVEKRKVQVTGGSTYIVSLPVKWIREQGIKQGDELFFTRKQNKSLLITAKHKSKNTLCKGKIDIYSHDRPVDVLRQIISYYLVGYDVLELIFKDGYNTENRELIKDSVRKRLIALEVMEETGKRIVFQNLLNYQQLPLGISMSNILRIVQSMQKDAKKTLTELNKNLAKDIIQRDTEVDRMYLLVVRQLKAALKDQELAKEMGISNVGECLGYRLVIKNVERIADHSESIARYSLNITAMSPEMIDHLRTVFELNEQLFKNIIECLNSKDRMTINSIINDSQKSADAVGKIDEMIFNNPQLSGRIYLHSISESLKRIAGYSADIAEVMLNMSIPEPDA